MTGTKANASMHLSHALPRSSYKTLALSALGGALEIYDFIIFVFFAKVMSQVFFPPEGPEWLHLLQTVCIFAAGYLARPLGGVLLAHWADRQGRKKVFTLSITMMALPCFVIGLMPTYAEVGYVAPGLLLLLRIIQGIAVGGEVPSAWVFVAEHSPPSRRGLSLGILQAGLTLGYLLAALTATALFWIFSPEEIESYVWRIPFVLGGLFGMVSLWLRQWLEETPLFLQMAAERAKQTAIPLKKVVSDHLSSAVPAAVLTCVLTSAVIITVVVMPLSMQQTYHLSALSSFGLTCVIIISLNIGCVVAGLWADRVGAWSTALFYSVLLPIGITILSCGLVTGGVWLILACAVGGLCCGIVGVVPSIMTALFPTDVRVSGIALIYNTVYSVWAGVVPPILIALMDQNTWACAWFALAIGLVGAITVGLYRRRYAYGTSLVPV